MSKKMTRTDRLYAMQGPALIEYAKSIGVKLPTNKTGTSLKCKKEIAVTKIIEAENRAAGAPAPAESERQIGLLDEVTLTVIDNETREQEVIAPAEELVAETTAEPVKKERKPRKAMDRSAQYAFEEVLSKMCADKGIVIKRWDNIKNLVALRLNTGKTFAEIRFGGKGIKLNVHTITADWLMCNDIGVGYALQKYYLPATLEIISYDNAADAMALLFDCKPEILKPSRKEATLRAAEAEASAE